jgi:arginase
MYETLRNDETIGWGFVGAPLDCSGTGRGERYAVSALKDAGIVDKLNVYNANDVGAAIDDSNRDSDTGVVGVEQIRSASLEIRSAVEAVLKRGARPFVVGGDCTTWSVQSPLLRNASDDWG